MTLADAVQGYACALAALTAGAALLAFLFALGARAWKRWRGTPHCVALSCLAAVAIAIGGSKPIRPPVVWDEGLSDDGTAVDEGNPRLVEFRWRYASWVPATATVTVEASGRLTADGTNGIWTVGTAGVTNRALSALMPSDATNYHYFVSQSYIPDAPVVTNGVFRLQCWGNRDVWVPKGVTVYADGEPLSYGGVDAEMFEYFEPVSEAAGLSNDIGELSGDAGQPEGEAGQ